jgi:hypothetical protein
MRPMRAGDPYRLYLRKKFLYFLLANVAGAFAATFIGLGAKEMRESILQTEFDARAVDVPAELRSALEGGDPEDLRAAVKAHPEETLRLIIDPAHGFTGKSQAERERILRACAEALPVETVRQDFSSLFIFHQVPESRKAAALRVLELSPDPGVKRFLESILPYLEGTLAEEARRIIAARQPAEAPPARGP